jgi:hypothetical protein
MRHLRCAPGGTVGNIGSNLRCTSDARRSHRRCLRELIRPRISCLYELIGALMAAPGDDTGGGTRHRDQGE